jgi:hypothetical protein
MPYRFEFDAENKVLLGTIEGHVTEQEFEEFFHSATLYAASVKPHSGIADFTGVTRFDVRREKLRAFAFGPPAFRDPRIPRVVVAQDPELFGLARMYQSLAEETRPLLNVVHTMKEAYEVLQLRNPRFEPLAPLETE